MLYLLEIWRCGRVLGNCGKCGKCGRSVEILLEHYKKLIRSEIIKKSVFIFSFRETYLSIKRIDLIMARQGRPRKEIIRVPMQVPETFKKEVERQAKDAGMKMSDFLETVTIVPKVG